MANLIVKKADEAEGTEYQQVVYAEVYAPNRLDAQNEYMTADEIQKMAWKFLAQGNTRKIDVGHDNKLVEAAVVESFIAREGDPIFIPGSWVVGVYIEDPVTWQKVLDGELNGFSMEAFVKRTEQTLNIEMPSLVSGDTTVDEGHSHKWYVNYSPEGLFLGGNTDEVNGHYHEIKSGTVTAESAGHIHRFSAVDDLDVITAAKVEPANN